MLSLFTKIRKLLQNTTDKNTVQNLQKINKVQQKSKFWSQDVIFIEKVDNILIKSVSGTAKYVCTARKS